MKPRRWFSASLAIAEVVIDDAVTEDSCMVVGWKLRATQVGECEGVAPTGQDVECSGIDLLRAEKCLLVDAWAIASGLDLALQIAAEPRP